jgi:ribosome recycling factor
MNPKVTEVQTDTKKRMDQGLDALKKELGAVRTGRAHAELLSPVVVEYYGTATPLNQLATVQAIDPQTLQVTPFDRSQLKEVEKAISAANLGLTPSADGGTIRVRVPVLTEERRKDLAKHVKKVGEDARVAVRNVRRDANEKVKKLEKGKEISQDEEKQGTAAIQTETDAHIKLIDDLVQKKEKEVLTV